MLFMIYYCDDLLRYYYDLLRYCYDLFFFYCYCYPLSPISHLVAHSNPVTAAIIAPNCVTNLLQSLQLRPLNPLQAAEGKIIITADVTRQIKVFENNSKLIEWLK